MGLGFVDEAEVKKMNREALDKELNRTDIDENQKNKIVREMLSKEAKRIADAKSNTII
jgi:hypothetical protein